MATRFYFPSTGAAPISPAPDAAWDKNATGFARLACVTTQINSAFVAKVITEDSNTTNALDWIAYQYVSGPLAAQTIAGTVSCWIQVRQNVSTNNYFSQLVVRVVSNDGATVRGTLVPAQNYTGTAGAGKFRATTTASAWGSRAFPVAADGSVSPAAGSDYVAGYPAAAVAAQDGDRLVIEFGHRANNTGSAAVTATYDIGDSAAADVVETEQSVTGDNNPWLEFSQTIAFQGSAPPTASVAFGSLLGEASLAASAASAAPASTVAFGSLLGEASLAASAASAAPASTATFAASAASATLAASATVGGAIAPATSAWRRRREDSATLDAADPLDPSHSRNDGLEAWWLAAPDGLGGPVWRDLRDRAPGVLAGGPTWRGADRPGGFGAVRFGGGGGDYVQIGRPPALELPSPLSVFAWVRSSPGALANYSFAVAKDAQGARGFGLGAYQGQYYLEVGGNPTIYQMGPALDDGAWHRIGATCDGSTWTGWADGAAIRAAGGGVPASTGADWRIGGRAYAGIPSPWTGDVDDVPVWSRALAADAVAEDLRLGRGGYAGVLRRAGPSLAPVAGPAAAPTFSPAVYGHGAATVAGAPFGGSIA